MSEQLLIPAVKRTSKLALISMITSFPTLLIWLLAPIPLVTGVVAIVRINNPARNLAGKGFAITGIVIGGLALLLTPLLLAIVIPSMAKAHQAANRVVSSANLRALYQSCHAYSSTNNGAFPPNLGALIKSELSDPRALIHPNSGKVAPAASLDELAAWTDQNSDYIYLGGRADMPPQQVIAFENPALPATREGLNILFGDGTTQWLQRDAAAQILRAAGQPID